MIELERLSMFCGHCVRAVTAAVQQADAAAAVGVNLPTKRLQIETAAPREAVVAQLAAAGYAPA